MYGYVLGDPVSFIDPTGEFVLFGIPVYYWLAGVGALGAQAYNNPPPSIPYGDACMSNDPYYSSEETPLTHPENFDNVPRSKAKRKDNEYWLPDLLHKDHWEVYKGRKNWEKGKRDRSTWNDGRPKDKF